MTAIAIHIIDGRSVEHTETLNASLVAVIETYPDWSPPHQIAESLRVMWSQEEGN